MIKNKLKIGAVSLCGLFLASVHAADSVADVAPSEGVLSAGLKTVEAADVMSHTNIANAVSNALYALPAGANNGGLLIVKITPKMKAFPKPALKDLWDESLTGKTIQQQIQRLPSSAFEQIENAQDGSFVILKVKDGEIAFDKIIVGKEAPVVVEAPKVETVKAEVDVSAKAEADAKAKADAERAEKVAAQEKIVADLEAGLKSLESDLSAKKAELAAAQEKLKGIPETITVTKMSFGKQQTSEIPNPALAAVKAQADATQQEVGALEAQVNEKMSELKLAQEELAKLKS